MIELKATTLRKGRVILSESWASNGYWAVRKSFLTNARIFSSEDTARAFSGHKDYSAITDEAVERTIPKDGLVKLTRTPVKIVNGRTEAVVFQRHDAYVAVSCSILKDIGLDDAWVLYQGPEPGTPIVDKMVEPKRILMPFNVTEETLAYLAPIKPVDVAKTA